MPCCHCNKLCSLGCSCVLTDAGWPGLQMRLQRPTVSAEMSFMLAVAGFFIPSFGLGGTTPTPFQSFDLLLTGATCLHLPGFCLPRGDRAMVHDS